VREAKSNLKPRDLLTSIDALSVGCYPEYCVTNCPVAARLHRDFSVQSYTYRP
jgi:hypothetical protein